MQTKRVKMWPLFWVCDWYKAFSFKGESPLTRDSAPGPRWVSVPKHPRSPWVPAYITFQKLLTLRTSMLVWSMDNFLPRLLVVNPSSFVAHRITLVLAIWQFWLLRVPGPLLLSKQHCNRLIMLFCNYVATIALALFSLYAWHAYCVMAFLPPPRRLCFCLCWFVCYQDNSQVVDETKFD